LCFFLDFSCLFFFFSLSSLFLCFFLGALLDLLAFFGFSVFLTTSTYSLWIGSSLLLLLRFPRPPYCGDYNLLLSVLVSISWWFFLFRCRRWLLCRRCICRLRICRLVSFGFSIQILWRHSLLLFLHFWLCVLVWLCRILRNVCGVSFLWWRNSICQWRGFCRDRWWSYRQWRDSINRVCIGGLRGRLSSCQFSLVF